MLSLIWVRAVVVIVFTLMPNDVEPYNTGSVIGRTTHSGLFIFIADLWLDIEFCELAAC